MGGDDVVVGGDSSAGGDQDEAVLEDGGGESEDEVDVALHAAGAIELAEGIGAEGVLVAKELAVLEDGSVTV